MKNDKFLNMFLLCSFGIFNLLGIRFGIILDIISSISIITWAIIFTGRGKEQPYKAYKK